MQSLAETLKSSIDANYNVKNINEVTRVITVLERMHVTREDLEKTRLGKTINELRRKTTDKELAKRAKKLIKTWQSLMVSSGPNVLNVHSNSTTPNAALTSPFTPHSALTSPSDTNDEDSNSSVFSNLSADGVALINSRSLLGSPSASNGIGGNNIRKQQHQRNGSSRKRKLDSETPDSLRENINSIMISGSLRLQSTQELAQKFNVQIKPSLSASSSPLLQVGRDDTLSPAKRAKLPGRNGTTYKNGFHHHDESSLDFDSAKRHSSHKNHQNHHHNNKSLPASPALLLTSFRNASHSANTSPATQLNGTHEDEKSHAKVAVKMPDGNSSLLPSPETVVDSTLAQPLPLPTKRQSSSVGRTVTEVDRDIAEIYRQLPPIKAEDLEWLEQFKFDTDDPVEQPQVKEEGEEEGQRDEQVERQVTEPTVKVEEGEDATEATVDSYILDRFANEQWEHVNGNFDKDGVWHDFGEMTSAFVLTGGKNASNRNEDNVLHILPYVNYTW